MTTNAKSPSAPSTVTPSYQKVAVLQSAWEDPAHSHQLLAEGRVTGVSPQEFVAAMQAYGKSANAVSQVAAAISTSITAIAGVAKSEAETQGKAFDSLKAAAAERSPSLENIALSLETDQSRLAFLEAFIQHEKEKTEQGKTTERMNRDNNESNGAKWILGSALAAFAIFRMTS